MITIYFFDSYYNNVHMKKAQEKMTFEINSFSKAIFLELGHSHQDVVAGILKYE